MVLLPPDKDTPHFQLGAPRCCHPNARPPKPSDGHTWNEAAVSSDNFFKRPCTTWPLLERTDNPCTPNTSHTFSSLDVGHPRGQEPVRERGTPPRPQDAATSRAGTHGRGQADPHDAPVPRGPLSPPPSCSGLSSQGSSAARDPGQASQPSLGCDCLPSCFTGEEVAPGPHGMAEGGGAFCPGAVPGRTSGQ